MQLVNVALGGTLIQDLPAAIAQHHTAPGADLLHPVWAERDSLLCQLYGPSFSVNSAHHQAVARMGAGLRVTAWAEHGVAEALEHTAQPVLGLQFHPERMAFALRREDTIDGGLILRHFVCLCRG